MLSDVCTFFWQFWWWWPKAPSTGVADRRPHSPKYPPDFPHCATIATAIDTIFYNPFPFPLPFPFRSLLSPAPLRFLFAISSEYLGTFRFRATVTPLKLHIKQCFVFQVSSPMIGNADFTWSSCRCNTVLRLTSAKCAFVVHSRIILITARIPH